MRLGRRYVLSSQGAHFYAARDYSWTKTWRAVLQSARTLALYQARRNRVAAAWRNAHAELSSRAAWDRRLGLAAPPVAPEETFRQVRAA
jgi:hypothetical protein